MIHSFLLVGQSNMAGRGFPSEVEPIDTQGLFVLRNGRWISMFTPVNPDKSVAGVNLAESFARRYADEHGVEVGLIPCAYGGSSLDMWQVGGLLFDYACYMTELASRTSTVVGILWHQGESDSSVERYPEYEEKLTVILRALRERTGLTDVPLILGGLGDFLSENTNPVMVEKLRCCDKVNEAIVRVAEREERCGFASARGLSHNGDYLHFNASALRELGLRYYEEFKRLEAPSREYSERATADSVIHTEFENL